MANPHRMHVAALRAVKTGLQQIVPDFARFKTVPAALVDQADAGRAEQARVDRVEIPVVTLEDLQERAAEIRAGAFRLRRRLDVVAGDLRSARRG